MTYYKYDPNKIRIFNSKLTFYCLIELLQPILGKMVKQPVGVNQEVVNELKELSQNHFNFPVITGKTMSNEHLYESKNFFSMEIDYIRMCTYIHVYKYR